MTAHKGLLDWISDDDDDDDEDDHDVKPVSSSSSSSYPSIRTSDIDALAKATEIIRASNTKSTSMSLSLKDNSSALSTLSNHSSESEPGTPGDSDSPLSSLEPETNKPKIKFPPPPLQKQKATLVKEPKTRRRKTSAVIRRNNKRIKNSSMDLFLGKAKKVPKAKKEDSVDTILAAFSKNYYPEALLNIKELNALELEEEIERQEREEAVTLLRNTEKAIFDEIEKRVANNGFNGVKIPKSRFGSLEFPLPQPEHGGRNLRAKPSLSSATKGSIFKDLPVSAKDILPLFDVAKETSRAMHYEVIKSDSSEYNTREDVYIFAPIYIPYTCPHPPNVLHNLMEYSTTTTTSSRPLDTIKEDDWSPSRVFKGKPGVSTNESSGYSSDVIYLGSYHEEVPKLEPPIETPTRRATRSNMKTPINPRNVKEPPKIALKKSEKEHIPSQSESMDTYILDSSMRPSKLKVTKHAARAPETVPWWHSVSQGKHYDFHVHYDWSSRTLEQEALQVFIQLQQISPEALDFLQDPLPEIPLPAMPWEVWNWVLLNFISLADKDEQSCVDTHVQALSIGFDVKNWSAQEAIRRVFLSAGMELEIWDEIFGTVSKLSEIIENESQATSSSKRSSPSLSNSIPNTNSNSNTALCKSLDFAKLKKPVLSSRFLLPQISSVKLAIHLSERIIEQVAKQPSSNSKSLTFLRLLVLALAAFTTVDTSLLDRAQELDILEFADRLFNSVPDKEWSNTNTTVLQTYSQLQNTPPKYQGSFILKAVSLIFNLFPPHQFPLRLRFLEAFDPKTQLGRSAEFHRYIATAFSVSSIYQESKNPVLLSAEDYKRICDDRDNSNLILNLIPPEISEKPAKTNTACLVDIYFDFDNISEVIKQTILPFLRTDTVFASTEDYKFQELVTLYLSRFSTKSAAKKDHVLFNTFIDEYLSINKRKASHQFSVLEQRKRFYDAVRIMEMLKWVKSPNSESFDKDKDDEDEDEDEEEEGPTFIATGLGEARARIIFMCCYALHNITKVDLVTRRELISRFEDIYRGLQNVIQNGPGEYARILRMTTQDFKNSSSQSDTKNLDESFQTFKKQDDDMKELESSQVASSKNFFLDAMSLEVVISDYIRLIHSTFPNFSAFDDLRETVIDELSNETLTLGIYKSVAKKIRSEAGQWLAFETGQRTAKDVERDSTTGLPPITQTSSTIFTEDVQIVDDDPCSPISESESSRELKSVSIPKSKAIVSLGSTEKNSKVEGIIKSALSHKPLPKVPANTKRTVGFVEVPHVKIFDGTKGVSQLSSSCNSVNGNVKDLDNEHKKKKLRKIDGNEFISSGSEKQLFVNHSNSNDEKEEKVDRLENQESLNHNNDDKKTVDIKKKGVNFLAEGDCLDEGKVTKVPVVFNQEITVDAGLFKAGNSTTVSHKKRASKKSKSENKVHHSQFSVASLAAQIKRGRLEKKSVTPKWLTTNPLVKPPEEVIPPVSIVRKPDPVPINNVDTTVDNDTDEDEPIDTKQGSLTTASRDNSSFLQFFRPQKASKLSSAKKTRSMSPPRGIKGNQSFLTNFFGSESPSLSSTTTTAAAAVASSPSSQPPALLNTSKRPANKQPERSSKRPRHK